MAARAGPAVGGLPAAAATEDRTAWPVSGDAGRRGPLAATSGQRVDLWAWVQAEHSPEVTAYGPVFVVSMRPNVAAALLALARELVAMQRELEMVKYQLAHERGRAGECACPYASQKEHAALQ